MPIDAVAASNGGMYATEQKRQPKQEMDGEVFMSLLVTQLRNQDPTSPMDTDAMIQQTTQLAMMEQMTNMADAGDESFALQMRTSAAALVGLDVSYADEEGEDAVGTVTSVSFDHSKPTVHIGDLALALDKVSGVVTTDH